MDQSEARKWAVETVMQVGMGSTGAEFLTAYAQELAEFVLEGKLTTAAQRALDSRRNRE